MKKQKEGISLVVLIITVIIMVILVSVVVISVKDTEIIVLAKETVGVTRLRELQHAANDIISDYQILSENDARIRNMALSEYILERLELEYNLTAEEKTAIVIDDLGHISNATE